MNTARPFAAGRMAFFKRDPDVSSEHDSVVKHWLVKSEPDTYAWSTFVDEGSAAWTGIRNFQARNHLRVMKRGDAVLFYHSGDDKEIVGVARVVRTAYGDPTAVDGDWSCIDLAAGKPLSVAVSLARIKTDPILRHMVLVKNSRLSVQPVTQEQFNRVLQLARAQV